eukprot:CAMPEP_0195605510 /NCGR_PEP_ID=MMETSP0815-20121206/7194_1 /TAXON_ID=97485 /ORGANISM="Prymnesium parvum, Strain Texoma1" /LENGTH=34 /DNA_ID= /DNA_START= /DNA_END= /DNA_ORIENTATION=
MKPRNPQSVEKPWRDANDIRMYPNEVAQPQVDVD